ncbi:MAG: hypothetical protein L0Z70_00465, partial [Chloroflexi bacterium]|nr:hypothetical protein [Chloroflexota bacterium]
MKTKYSLRFISLLLLAAIWLSACTPSAPGEKTDGAYISFMVFGDPAELAAYQSLVAAFHAKSPGVQVNLT